MWPFQPSLEVDDPVISQWLQQDGIVIYRRGKELADSHTHIIKGEVIEGGCIWHVSSSASEDGIVTTRTLATNYTTCESLMEEGES